MHNVGSYTRYRYLRHAMAVAEKLANEIRQNPQASAAAQHQLRELERLQRILVEETIAKKVSRASTR